MSVHPHIRGEYNNRIGDPSGSVGSSPHPWGIPLFFTTKVSIISVHPHIRGEYTVVPSRAGTPVGSSPHPWGILYGYGLLLSALRFIPTSVGNTLELRFMKVIVAVHPHIRGEYQIDVSDYVVSVGSSPHPWGIPRYAIAYKCQLRFIPTSVGNTPSSL